MSRKKNKTLKNDIRFAQAILDGTKTHTIRRETDLELGDTCELVSSCDLSGEEFIALVSIRTIQRIIIEGTGEIFLHGICPDQFDKVRDRDAFARDDGFKDADEMFDYFEGRYVLPFEGFLIKWV